MKLLIIEDEQGIRNQYKWGLKNYDMLFAEDAESAVKELVTHRPELVLLDLGLPPDPDNASVGLKLLSEIKVSSPGTKVIVLTGSEQREHALQSIKLGAHSYLQKGVELSKVQNVLDQAAFLFELELENSAIKEQSYESSTTLLGKSDAITDAVKLMMRIAPSDVSTLLRGESGTGKELFAQNLHDLSGRKGEFVAINCASIPSELLESELFGHEKGAFTGAVKAKKGKVEQAHEGTLFLDEIGDMPLELQSKMLRFLQERKIERVGGTRPVPVNVRVICATHRDLKQMKSQHQFREDLYFRLAEFELNIPPLRERGKDVCIIAEYLLENARVSNPSLQAKSFSKDALCAMMDYPWHGNVRELQNKVKRATLLCDGDVIGAVHLDLPFKENMLLVPDSWLDGEVGDELTSYKELEKHHMGRVIFETYLKHDKNIQKAAEALGISRPTFYAKAKRFGLRTDSDEDSNS
jgi:two-component system NtrC family response regulator